MRLSEAIRLGAMLKPQAYGPPSGLVLLKFEPRICALAAASLAVGNESLNVFLDGIRWPVLCRPVQCPVCGGVGVLWPLSLIVVELNDQHRWTRERIADWVETLESPDERRVQPDAAEFTRA